MAERDSLWVTGVIDQEEARVGQGAVWTPSISAVKAKTGIRPGPGNPGAVTATGTPDANVHVAPFQAVLQSGRGTVSGVYVMTLDAIKDINILSTPAHATLARNDLIIAHQADTFYGDGNSTMTVRQVVGTPSGSPADPSTASFPDSITLARVRVDALATTIVSGKITDLRPASVVAVGGLLPVASQSLRNALTGIYDGMPIYRTDRDWVEIYDGAAWRVHGVGIVANFADLTAITNPATGQLAYSTGDTLMYRYTGSAWRVQGAYRTTQTLGSAAATVTFSSIPTYLTALVLTWTARSDAVTTAVPINLKINNDGSAGYFGNYLTTINTTQTITPTTVAGTIARIGAIPAASAGAAKYAAGVLEIPGWASPHQKLNMTYRSHFYDTAANSFLESGGWLYDPNGPYTSLVLSTSGNFITGSSFTLSGAE